MLALRFNAAAWEISNRSADFLFIGLALVLAMARFPQWVQLRRLLRPLLAGGVTVIFSGGVIAGWSPQLRLEQVYQPVVGNRRFEPAGLSAAIWVRTYLGPHRRIAADVAEASYLLVYGAQDIQSSRDYKMQGIFEAESLQDWQIQVLQDRQIEYLAIDRRLISSNNMAGIFFDHGSQWPLPSSELLQPEIYAKFDAEPGVSRIFDSGDLVVYDVRTWLHGAAQP